MPLVRPARHVVQVASVHKAVTQPRAAVPYTHHRIVDHRKPGAASPAMASPTGPVEWKWPARPKEKPPPRLRGAAKSGPQYHNSALAFQPDSSSELDEAHSEPRVSSGEMSHDDILAAKDALASLYKAHTPQLVSQVEAVVDSFRHRGPALQSMLAALGAHGIHNYDWKADKGEAAAIGEWDLPDQVRAGNVTLTDEFTSVYERNNAREALRLFLEEHEPGSLDQLPQLFKHWEHHKHALQAFLGAMDESEPTRVPQIVDGIKQWQLAEELESGNRTSVDEFLTPSEAAQAHAALEEFFQRHAPELVPTTGAVILKFRHRKHALAAFLSALDIDEVSWFTDTIGGLHDWVDEPNATAPEEVQDMMAKLEHALEAHTEEAQEEAEQAQQPGLATAAGSGQPSLDGTAAMGMSAVTPDNIEAALDSYEFREAKHALTAFYTRTQPKLVPYVDSIVERFRGRKGALLAFLDALHAGSSKTENTDKKKYTQKGNKRPSSIL